MSALALLALGMASGQIYPPGGGYPGGGYPPTYPGGRTPYPGQRGPSIPLPGRKSKDTQKTDANQPLPNFRGSLKRMDDKTISIEMGDNRVLDFKRNSKTKFLKGGEELKTPKFNEGDQISVEASEDPTGYLTAVNVYWEKAAGAPDTAASKSSDGVVDTWAKDAPGATPEKKPDTAAEAKPAAKIPNGPPDADDPGPPRLRRGGAADPTRERAPQAPAGPVPEVSPAERQAAETARGRDDAPPSIRRIGDEDVPPPSIRRIGDDDAPPLVVSRPAVDDIIRKATDAALDFTETLPAYVCQEMMSRYESSSRPTSWHALDVVSMNLVYENGKEDYRDLAINGKVQKGKSMEEIGGAWSTGEFGTVLIDLFSPGTAADFKFQRDSRISGMSTKLYDFKVDREHSHWDVHMGSQSYMPPYKGSVWIDPQTGRVLRIEMQAFGFPQTFPIDHVESATDYQYIRLGDAKQYLLPVHAETLSCQRGSDNCSRNTIDFRNYHKYSGESNITFGAPKDPKDK